MKKMAGYIGLLGGMLMATILVGQPFPHQDAVTVAFDQVRLIPQELGSIFTYPVRHPDETLWFTGTTLALITVDRTTTQFVQQSLNPLLDKSIDYPPLFNLGGITGVDGALILGAGTAYLSGITIQDSQLQVAAFRTLKAYTYSYLVTHIFLKSITGRTRPDSNLAGSGDASTGYTKDPWAFGNFHPVYFESDRNGTSFPSFHFTAYFAVAKTLQRTYDDWVIPYGICALALLPDFKSHHHWVSDMVAGAWIGTIIGNEIADQHLTGPIPPAELQSKSALQIQPVFFDEGGAGMQLVLGLN